MSEIVVGGHAYRAGKMLVKKQLHVIRRMAPVLKDLASLATLRKGADMADMMTALSPVVNAIGAMSDADVDYVMASCLSVCLRQEGAAWVSVWNVQAGAAQFADIALPALLQLTAAVMRENFSDFLDVIPQVSAGPPESQSLPVAG